MKKNEQIDRIVAFLNSVGLPVTEKSLPSDTFLPGIRLENGGLAIDRGALLYPGDMLHEAGHLAVMAPSERKAAYADAGEDGGAEMASQAWSYAAAVACGIPADILFHEQGYKGDAPALREHFTTDGTLGVPLLVWYGMTSTSEMGFTADGPEYPAMRLWLREVENPEDRYTKKSG